jgi:hypothetical protein
MKTTKRNIKPILKEYWKAKFQRSKTIKIGDVKA